MKEFVDQEKTRAKEVDTKPIPKFNWSDEETDDTQEEDLSLGIIYMIGGPNYLNLENMIQGGDSHDQTNERGSMGPING